MADDRKVVVSDGFGKPDRSVSVQEAAEREEASRPANVMDEHGQVVPSKHVTIEEND